MPIRLQDTIAPYEGTTYDMVDANYIGAGSGLDSDVFSDNTIGLGKIVNIADDRILGNISGSAGAPTELTAANVLTLIGVTRVLTSINNYFNVLELFILITT